MKIRAITLEVYSNPSYRACSNGGISERFDTIYIEHSRGNVTIDTDNPPPNFCRVVTRNLFGSEYKHIEPYAPTKQGSVGYMSGGSFASACDSRFSEISRYPLAIHDRSDTQTEYERMSH